MYNPRLLEHYKNPRNRGTLEKPDFKTGQYNPSCGDAVSLTGTLSKGRVTAVMFTGHGCILSQAAASLLTEFVKNMPIALIGALTPEDMKKLVGMELGPNRVKCIMLCLIALQEGVATVLPEKPMDGPHRA